MLEINLEPVLIEPSLGSFEDDHLGDSTEDDIFLNTLDFSVFAAKALGNILNEAAGNFSLYQDTQFSDTIPLTEPGLGFIEELELDEEINSLEEEIARIEEHKRLLKMASLPGSPLATPVLSLPTYEIKLDFLSESLEQLLPNTEQKEKIIKTEQPIQPIQTPIQPKKDKTRKRKSPSSSSIKTKKMRNEEEELDFDPITIQNKDNKKKKLKTTTTTTRKKSAMMKIDLAEIFKLEEILKIKNVSQDEDEYVDIL